MHCSTCVLFKDKVYNPNSYCGGCSRPLNEQEHFQYALDKIDQPVLCIDGSKLALYMESDCPYTVEFLKGAPAADIFIIPHKTYLENRYVKFVNKWYLSDKLGLTDKQISHLFTKLTCEIRYPCMKSCLTGNSRSRCAKVFDTEILAALSRHSLYVAVGSSSCIHTGPYQSWYITERTLIEDLLAARKVSDIMQPEK